MPAHQPPVLLAGSDLGAALAAALEQGEREVVASTVSALLGNAYEQNQHEQVCRRLGYPDGWNAACTVGPCDASTRVADRRV